MLAVSLGFVGRAAREARAVFAIRAWMDELSDVSVTLGSERFSRRREGDAVLITAARVRRWRGI
jgi:hypothetical protein